MNKQPELIVDLYGTKRWILDCDSHREYHREDGPAIERNGEKEWYLNGKRHRVDGPAIEDPDGYKAWFVDGKYHRIDGPAIELPSGNKYWYIDGKKYSADEWLQALTPEQQYNYLWSLNE
jgi:hypothetical protein